MLEDAEISSIAEGCTQAEEEAKQNGDGSEGVTDVRRQKDNELLNNFSPQAQASRDGNGPRQELLARQTTPFGGAPFSPLRPPTSRRPLSESGFSHISSPANIVNISPCPKRPKLEHVAENMEYLYEAPLVSSPGFASISSTQKKENFANSGSMSSDPSYLVDLPDVPSPSAGPPTHVKRVKLETVRSPLPSPRKRVRTSRSDSIESEWPSEVVTPDDESSGTCASLHIVEEFSDGSDSIHSPELLDPSTTKKKLQVHMLQRQNGVALHIKKKSVRRKGEKRKEVLDEDLEEPQEELTHQIKSVMASWREKFSHEPSSVRMCLSCRMSVSTNNDEHQTTSRRALVLPTISACKPRPSVFLSRRIRPASPTQPLQRRQSQDRPAEECGSKPEDEYPRKASQESDTHSPEEYAKKPAKISMSTSSVLEAFRFRPASSASPCVASLSSQ